MVSEIAISRDEFQQVYNLRLSEGSCFLPFIRLDNVNRQLFRNESESDTTSKDTCTSSSLSATCWLCTNSAISEFCTVYWLSTCKVLSTFVKYLTWSQGNTAQLLCWDYKMVVIWLRLHLMQGFFFFPWQYGAFSFFFGSVFFIFFTQGLFSAFDFSIGVSEKSFRVGIFVKCVM